jgi:hypothetical protein
MKPSELIEALQFQMETFGDYEITIASHPEDEGRCRGYEIDYVTGANGELVIQPNYPSVM